MIDLLADIIDWAAQFDWFSLIAIVAGRFLGFVFILWLATKIVCWSIPRKEA